MVTFDHNAFNALNSIYAEYQRAISRFDDFKSPHEGYAILLEEVDELWEEIKHNKSPGARDRMRAEAIQVGTMALRFIVMLDEYREAHKDDPE